MRLLLLSIMLILSAAPVIAAQGDGGDDPVQRGAYLAAVGDCTSCHTAGHGYFAGGLPLKIPFGTIFSTNITPDPTDGIGRYTREQFFHVMRDGVAADGHHLYPAMPYASFSAVTDEDLDALYQYLMKGVKPVSYKPPETKLIFPFNQRWGLAIWDAVFARHDRYAFDPAHDGQWNRGAYLVQGLGHCGACHTPRGLAYEEKGYDQWSPVYLHGSVADDWATANLSGDLGSGLGRWSEDDIASFLATGHGGHGAAFGNMKEAVEKSTQFITESDRAAIARYLKSFPIDEDGPSYKPKATNAVNAENMEAEGGRELPGAGLFAQSCAGCHGPDGEGKPPRFPTLAGNPVVLTLDGNSLVRIILEGSASPDTQSGPKVEKMPSFARFTSREIAQIVSFLRQSWGNYAPPVSEADVSSFRAALADRDKSQAKARAKADGQS